MLILAIEPDRRQSTRLGMIVRNQMRAELQVVDTVDQALAVIDDRDPDLILTSPVLSGKDQIALADRLRKLAAEGFRVPTITIPAFGTPGQRPRMPQQRGAQERGRTVRARATPFDGVDPVVFGIQISSQMERAAAERAAAGVTRTRSKPPSEAPQVARPAAPQPPPSAVMESDEPADWSNLLAAMRREIEAARTAHDSCAPETAPLDFSWLTVDLDPDPPAVEARAAQAPAPSATRVEAVREAPALRSSAARVETGSTPAVPTDPAPAPPASASPDAGPAPRSRRSKKVRRVPPQDEFGFFDPRQCGFTALFAKLHEINDNDDPPSPKKPS